MAAGYSLAEIHVLRNLHKEKMKTIKGEERSAKKQYANDRVMIKEEKSSGCFFWVYKKVHPSNSRTVAFAEKGAMETWDSKG
ncbi:hypothetical protein CIPAW_06G023100 [Carya illinoinensis]|uniref:Uncharacterized protein n=1 Tax=Carya illinoinensis TaxID=32201 RepID=A0A8T1Q6Y4_CARIL|nr:hypothetical protein CIPAW_06G023100 [Carya illinoinensis]